MTPASWISISWKVFWGFGAHADGTLYVRGWLFPHSLSACIFFRHRGTFLTSSSAAGTIHLSITCTPSSSHIAYFPSSFHWGEKKDTFPTRRVTVGHCSVRALVHLAAFRAILGHPERFKTSKQPKTFSHVSKNNQTFFFLSWTGTVQILWNPYSFSFVDKIYISLVSTTLRRLLDYCCLSLLPKPSCYSSARLID